MRSFEAGFLDELIKVARPRGMTPNPDAPSRDPMQYRNKWYDHRTKRWYGINERPPGMPNTSGAGAPNRVVTTDQPTGIPSSTPPLSSVPGMPGYAQHLQAAAAEVSRAQAPAQARPAAPAPRPATQAPAPTRRPQAAPAPAASAPPPGTTAAEQAAAQSLPSNMGGTGAPYRQSPAATKPAASKQKLEASARRPRRQGRRTEKPRRQKASNFNEKALPKDFKKRYERADFSGFHGGKAPAPAKAFYGKAGWKDTPETIARKRQARTQRAATGAAGAARGMGMAAAKRPTFAGKAIRPPGMTPPRPGAPGTRPGPANRQVRAAAPAKPRNPLAGYPQPNPAFRHRPGQPLPGAPKQPRA